MSEWAKDRAGQIFIRANKKTGGFGWNPAFVRDETIIELVAAEQHGFDRAVALLRSDEAEGYYLFGPGGYLRDVYPLPEEWATWLASKRDEDRT